MDYEVKMDWVSESMYSYFIIVNYVNKTLYDTSARISDIFDIDLEEYNKKLINEVIKSDHYEIYDGSSKGRRLYKDLTFKAFGEDKVYIERFKEVFCKELIMLAMGC